MADGFFRPGSGMLAGYTLSYGTYSAFVQKVSLVDSAGVAVGGGDASAENQTSQITQETLINTRLGDITTPAAGTVNARLAALLTGPLVAGGVVAHDAVYSGNHVGIGGYASTAAPTAVAVGDAVRGWFTTAGAQVVGCPSAALTGVDALSNSIQSFSDAFGATLRLHVRPEVFNGTTWDRTRSGAAAAGLTTGLGTASVEECGRSYSHISTATTTVVKSGVGHLHTININSLGTGASTATIYDNTAGSGTVIAVVDTLAQLRSLVFDLAFATGLTIVTTGTVAPDITVTYR